MLIYLGENPEAKVLISTKLRARPMTFRFMTSPLLLYSSVCGCPEETQVTDNNPSSC